MRIQLKEFQEDVVRRLFGEVQAARDEIRRRGNGQAVVFSSPTGSGKTVMATALMELLWKGMDSVPGDDRAVFLWLSDMPELNNQTCDKVLTQSSEFHVMQAEIIENSFDAERLVPGRIYFLNTQKLAKDTLLTKVGDGRRTSIWQTIENTARAQPDSFYLIIDEAHRGMGETAHERRTAETIVQRFIKGEAGVGLSPVQLILGISATPQRFIGVMSGNRAVRLVSVDAEAVRTSGLLKERISLFCQPDSGPPPDDFDLLAEAARRWKRFRDEWRGYGLANPGQDVAPVLVVQVEDGGDEQLTKTNLETAVKVLEREMGDFAPGELGHCFDKDTPVPVGDGRVLRKVAPAQIQTLRELRVVFFKMALTTGWDCPRAEVMMSFRRACDHTLIAQLVGRMVRTPLARRVEGRDLLNTVSLFLPHYDEAGLRAILADLNDPEKGVPTQAENGWEMVSLGRRSGTEDCFARLQMLPTYQVERLPPLSNVQRLVRLGRRLTADRLAKDAWPAAKSLVLQVLGDEHMRLTHDSSFREKLAQAAEIELREVEVACGLWQEFVSNGAVRVPKTPESIQTHFESCGRILGEGLHDEYWHRVLQEDDPDASKLEIAILLHDKTVLDALEDACHERLEGWWRDHAQAIQDLPEVKRQEYDRIRRRAKSPQALTCRPVETLEARRDREGQEWDRHLYVDGKGRFPWNANSWETAVLEAELAGVGFVGWLRNQPRRPESLCVPYRTGGEDRACYPDLLVFRRDGAGMVVDLLDPHDPGLPDAPDKAVGLADYARRHGEMFGRIELIIQERGELLRLNVNRESIRDRVRTVRDQAYLLGLFHEFGR